MTNFCKGLHPGALWRKAPHYCRALFVFGISALACHQTATAQDAEAENPVAESAAKTDPPQLKLDDPLPENIYYGNLIKDGKVDFLDVNRLATKWNDTQTLYRKRNLLLLNQVATHFGEDIPAVLNAIGWENRALFTSLDGAVKRTPNGNLAPLSKADEPLSIGRGFSNKDFITKVVGLPIYPFNATQLVKVSSGLGTNDPRYDSVPLNEFSSTYIDSFATAADVFGFDMNAEAKYAAFQGTFSANYDRSAFRSNKKHEFVVSQTIDFGWWELPRDEIVVDPTVLAELSSPDGGYEKYGTHYVWAERRKASAYMRILIETSVAQDKKKFSTDLDTHFEGSGWSAALAASTSSLSETFSDISKVTIEIEFKGGKLIDFSVDANDAAAVATIPSKMAEWSATVEADKAIPTEWAVRPVTDFVATDTMGLIGRDVSMRRWFLKYSAVDNRLQELNAIIDTTFLDPDTQAVIPRFRSYYRYFEEGDRTPDDFYEDYLWYKAKETELRAIGRNLYVDETALFVSKDHPLREVDKSPIFLTSHNGFYPAADPSHSRETFFHQLIEFTMFGGNWTGGNGYLLNAPYLCGGPSQANGNEFAGIRNPANNAPDAVYDSTDNSTSGIIFSAQTSTSANEACFASSSGVTLEIRDLQDQNRLVFYQCIRPDCGGVSKPEIPEPPFDIFKSAYELAAEKKINEQFKGDR